METQSCFPLQFLVPLLNPTLTAGFPLQSGLKTLFSFSFTEKSALKINIHFIIPQESLQIITDNFEFRFLRNDKKTLKIFAYLAKHLATLRENSFKIFLPLKSASYAKSARTFFIINFQKPLRTLH